jgi:alkanesulfonate monooxygenase
VLFACGSGSPDPSVAAAYIASKTGSVQLLPAHRPNVSCPAFAARTFATIDQVSDGRVTVHFITGGTGREQQREGDYLTRRLGVDIISMRGYDLLPAAVPPVVSP